MKTIKKIKDNIGKVAGSALLVGATLTAGAAAVSAQDSGSSGDLGDYPAPFVSEDGEVDTTVVVGETAEDGEPVSTLDVVSAIEIAGSLGNAAFETTEESVEVSGSSGSWSASNGETLDTRNDDLYFSQNLNKVRSTLTDGDLDVLADTEFRDDGSNTYDITHNLNVGALPVTFGNGADELDNEDPAVHVEMPSEGSVGASTNSDYVLNMQASIDTIDVSDSDVAGEDIELFGRDYTIASEHSDSYSESYLTLYGSTQTISIETGQEQTVTIDGEDHTIEVVSVDATGGTSTASIRVDGSISQEDLDDEFDIDGQTVRVEEIINTGANDDGQGIVEFGIGSEELRVPSNGQIEDGEGDDVEGAYAQINGAGAFDPSGSDTEISSIDFYVGAEDDDEDALMSGESFSHSLFNQVELQFGGLNPDAAEDGDEVSVTTDSDDAAVLEFTGSSGDDASVTFAYDSTNEPTSVTDLELEDTDEDDIEVVEGSAIEEDEYFTADAGDFAHMWEVTSIDRDSEGGSGNFDSSDEAEIDLQDAVTGNTVTVDLDARDTGDQPYYSGTEIIDGQEYHFVLEGEDSSGSGTQFAPGNDDVAEFKVAYGSGSDLDTTVSGTSDPSNALSYGDISLFAAQDTDSDSAVALADDVDTGVATSGTNIGFELPSTESTDSAVVTLDTSSSDVAYVSSGSSNVELVSGTSTTATADTHVVVEVNGGQEYLFYEDGGTIQVTPAYETSTTDEYAPVEAPTAVTIQPEDDNDNEHAFAVTPGVDNNDNEVGIGDVGSIRFTGGYNPVSLESDDDMEVDYNMYGTYTQQDTDDQGDFTMMLPYGQSTVGAAVTGADGSLSAEGGASSGTVEASSPTYQHADAALDSEMEGSARTNSNLVLVGGPSVNSLVGELVDEGQTMAASEYTEGEGMIQMVNGFSDDQSALIVAGHSGEDTRAAGEFLADYRNNQEAMEGQSQVTVSTENGQVVE